jgi:hypothetical protein
MFKESVYAFLRRRALRATASCAIDERQRFCTGCHEWLTTILLHLPRT